ncbi:MAG: hypothetical protein HY360_05685, partial [Verrucomicrobia bacterium]|nr:hypothetical protein [Verrucomicrobiota bacterium]
AGQGEGARIVHDQAVPKFSSRAAKETPEFGRLIQLIRDKGFRSDELRELQMREKKLKTEVLSTGATR